MNTKEQRLPLDVFLALRAPLLQEDLRAERARLHDVTGYLGRHLGRQPDLATQVARLGDALPEEIAELPDTERRAAVTEAERLAADIKARWIAAEDPPLVEEIDDRLAEIADALGRMRRPGPEALRDAAQRIDRLGRAGASLDGLEQRYLPWAMGGGVLFLIGLMLMVNPGLLDHIPFLASFWTILFCLGALPAVGIHYARTVLPRSRADTEIDEINRDHFVPVGGLYFPAGEGPACVVTLGDMPEMTPGQQARAERRSHREKVGPFW